jgi:integration host factor subunit alpha
MTITKSDISKNIALKLSISSKLSKNFFECFINTVIKSSRTDVVKIANFGSFKIKNTKARLGRNPKTLETFEIKSVKKLNYYCSNKLKKTLNF